MSTETMRLIRDGEKGWGVGGGGRRYGGGGRGRAREIIFIYLSLHCHHQNDSCVKMGSDESRFNVSLIARDKVTRRCPQTTLFWKKRRAEVLFFPVALRRQKSYGLLDFETG